MIFQTDTFIYIATERIVPLRWHIKRKSMSTETLKWGLFGVAVSWPCLFRIEGVGLTSGQQTIKFINDEASSVHGAIRAGSIYTSESGEWKVGGFEVLSSMKDDDAVIYVCVSPITPVFITLICARIMEVWYQTLDDIHLPNWRNLAGVLSRATLLPQLTLIISVLLFLKFSMENSWEQTKLDRRRAFHQVCTPAIGDW